MSEFEDKKKALFDVLDAAEKSVNRTTVCEYDEDFGQVGNERNKRDKYVDKYKNRSSLFKRPDLPISKCLKSRRKADHEVKDVKLFKFNKSSQLLIIAKSRAI